MKLFGSLSRLVSILFRQNGNDITVRPNQSTTYTAARDIQLPEGDAAHVLVSRSSTDTLTNKTLTSPAISSPTGLVKADVGLANVDNTSDATKNAAVATFTNKTIDADLNFLSNIENADIKANAGIVYSKLSIADGDLTAAKTSGLPAVITNVSNLVTLSGVAADSANLGAFSGTIIADNQTVKNAIQSLETYVDALPDPFFYAGSYNATTDSPALDNADTNKNGYIYYVTVAGTQNFGAGAISFEVGDKVVNNGSTWDKWDMTSVTSASEITNTPAGGIAATNVQAAINELDSEKAAKTVEIQTNTDSGLSGGGDLSASRSLVIDPNNAPSATVAGGDLVLIADISAANALKKVTAQSIADLAAGSSAQSFTWTDGSATKACTHTFSTNAVLVEVYDENMETVLVDIVDRTSTSMVTLTRSEVTVGGAWTVVIRN